MPPSDPPSTVYWFVQTDFGTLLGPMPTDVVTEMVRAQELLPGDLIRQHTQSDWKRLSEISEFCPPGGSTKFNNEASDVTENHETPQRCNTEIDSPNLPHANTPATNIAIAADDQNEIPRSPPTTPPVPSLVAPTIGQKIYRQSKLTKTYIAFGWMRSRSHWSKWIALIVIVMAVWWLWPSSQYSVYERVMSICDELRTRRKNLDDTAGWEHFVVRANSELDQLVPWLEQHASPKNRELQLLLFACRDELPVILRKPRDSQIPQEKRLQILIQALQQLRGKMPTGQASAGSFFEQTKKADAKAIDPENGDSVLIAEPSLLRMDSPTPASP